MYFRNRAEAGKELANQLLQYKDTLTTVVALSDGGVVVAIQIAAILHCPLTMLMTEPIELPGETDPLAAIDQDGVFTYNHMYSTGQLEDFNMEYHHYIEQMKMDKLHKLHRMLGKDGLINHDLIRDHNVILVSDGFSTGFSMEAAAEYLKPVKVKKIVVATPLASMAAVDLMHIMTDEIHCLSVVDNYIGTNHYFDDNTIPSHDTIIKTISNIVAHWR